MRLPKADKLRKVSERDTAEWKLDGQRMAIVMKYKCSHCGNRSASRENFCSYCGARMTNAKSDSLLEFAVERIRDAEIN